MAKKQTAALKKKITDANSVQIGNPNNAYIGNPNKPNIVRPQPVKDGNPMPPGEGWGMNRTTGEWSRLRSDGYDLHATIAPVATGISPTKPAVAPPKRTYANVAQPVKPLSGAGKRPQINSTAIQTGPVALGNTLDSMASTYRRTPPKTTGVNERILKKKPRR